MLKTKDDTPGLERRSVTSALWSAVGGYGNVFLSFAVFLILARLLTPDEFGLVAIATGGPSCRRWREPAPDAVGEGLNRPHWSRPC